MVTITDGVKTFRVPAGAVKPYKSMGFRVASDAEVKEMKQTKQEHFDDDIGEQETGSSKNFNGRYPDEVDTDDKFIEELLEKPLSQWTNEEVKEFVRIKDIDTSGVQKVSQVRNIIKSYLEEQSKNI